MESNHHMLNNPKKTGSQGALSLSEGQFNRKRNSKSQVFETSGKNCLLLDSKYEHEKRGNYPHKLNSRDHGKKGTCSGLEMLRMSYLKGISEDEIRGSRCVVGDKKVKKKMINAIHARKNSNFEHDDCLDTSQTRSKSEMTTKTGNSRRIQKGSSKNVKLYPTMRRTARYTTEKMKPLKLHRKSKNKRSYGQFRTVEMALQNSEKRRKGDLDSSVEPNSKKSQKEELLNIITEDEEELRQSEEAFFPSLSKVTNFRSFEDDNNKPKDTSYSSSENAEDKSSTSDDKIDTESERNKYSDDIKKHDKMTFSPSRLSKNTNWIFNLPSNVRKKRSDVRKKKEKTPDVRKSKKELEIVKEDVHKPQKSAKLANFRVNNKRDLRISKDVKSKTSTVALKPRNKVGNSNSRDSSQDQNEGHLKKNIKMIFKHPEKNMFKNMNIKSRQKAPLSKAISHKIYANMDQNQQDIDFTVGKSDNIPAGRNSHKMQSSTQQNFKPKMGKEEIFQLLYSKDYSRESKYKRIPERRSSNDSRILPDLNLNTLVNKQLGSKLEKKMGKSNHAFMKTGSQGMIKPPHKKQSYDLSKLAMIQKTNTTPIISPKEYLRMLNSSKKSSDGLLSISERGIFGTLMKKAQEEKKKTLQDNLAKLSTTNR
ncbi:unnamed protein product [Moneuplotes crassus]|uniref:Uncharacterized protein n=1 Tax=Euplotes crassus TaxID=5936 RepID=A0AAD1Y184_EUPCR|nr:unnamed protein product [Moneuplotes crassus]